MHAMFFIKFDLSFFVKYVTRSIPNVQTSKTKQEYHKSLFYNLPIV